MRKHICLALLLALCLLLALPVFAAADSRFNKSDADLVLPSGLTEIEEEAFEGISAESVYLQEGVLTIGARAFADCGSLLKIRIPKSVTQIADDAFEGCPLTLKIYGVNDSEAKRFAKRVGISFANENGENTLPEIPLY